MNIITTIQAALTALNNDADLFLLEKSRAENLELENITDTIIVYPDWRTANTLNQGMEIIKTRVYNIDFKTPDEWDNSDGNTSKAYVNETSANRIENMKTLANSVFHYISTHNNLFENITKNFRWRNNRIILREGNGTMSGVNIQLTVVFSGERVCDYTP